MGRVMDEMNARGNQAGHWEVVIDRGEADPVVVNCVNRPAISFGEDLMRVADVEFERWFQRAGIEGVNVQLTKKRTLMMMVDSFDPERLVEYADNLRSKSSDEDDFQVAAMLTALAGMYEAVGDFLEPEGAG